MAPGKSSTSAQAAGEEVVLSQAFKAPRSLVFKAWTDPQQIAQWWGPHGFTNPRCEWDARPGGAIHIDMRGPDGTIYPMTGQFQEIAAPERLVFTSGVPDGKGGLVFEVQTAVTFAEQDGQTTVTVKARVLRKVAGAEAYLQGMEEGWLQTLVRLEQHVTTEDLSTKTKQSLFAVRTFNALRERVWEAWTDPKQIVQWWGPTGFTTTTEKMEVKAGGEWRLVMHGPDGRDYKNHIIYHEVVKPERLVYQHVPEKGTEPVNFHTVVTFEAQGQKTRLTMLAIFPSATALDYVVKNYGAFEGMQQTLGRLKAHVTKEKGNA